MYITEIYYVPSFSIKLANLFKKYIHTVHTEEGIIAIRVKKRKIEFLIIEEVVMYGGILWRNSVCRYRVGCSR